MKTVLSKRITRSALIYVLACLGLTLSLISCEQPSGDGSLPILGRSEIVEKKEGGKTYYDTIPHTISDFKFVNQDSVWVTNETFKGKVYVSDFFFTSCPTICPTMKKQMLRVYEKYKTRDEVGILSHTIDPRHDSVQVLKEYSERLGVDGKKWHFVTGNEDVIYELGETSYMVTAGEDGSAPGGYIHSGAFLLIDMDRRVRGVYDGTVADQVDVLMNDIEKLLQEYAK